ncbi:matrixin family metalloprotease [Haladaptatus sp. DYSN1]|uniref:matrixin family metalloprotease n=1 Tax=unclassified Haladaptatus TaxID=2622732 RepID=UPI0024052614|nr:matrixin family metalloprotease [Haladaptatus sp. DYSN1]
MNGRALLLTLLVVLAGCAAPLDPGFADTTSTQVQTTQPPADGTPNAVQTQTQTQTPGAVDSRSNPWQEGTLTIAVEAPDGDSRDYTVLLRDALDYWEANSEQYAGYALSFDVEPNANDADVVVEFVERVDTCGEKREVAGCAPYITDSRQINRPERIQVLTGLSDSSTVLVIQHEFGHAMGLNHDDEPADIMAGHANLTTLPMTNATDKPNPWDRSELRVYVDYSAVRDRDRAETREQVQHALDYYASGAEGYVPTNISFVSVDSEAEADVVIQFTDASPCGADPGSCGAVRGQDPDGDGELETYTNLQITLTGLDTEATGWHVGWWLGYGFGFSSESEYPAPFRDASYTDRRGDWWE